MKDKLEHEGIPKYFKPHPPITFKDQNPELDSQNKCPNAQGKCPSGQDMLQTASPEHQDKSSGPKTQTAAKKPRPSPTGVENLTDKAADLSISTRIQRPIPHHVRSDEAEVRRSPRIRAKRVHSVMDEVRLIKGVP